MRYVPFKEVELHCSNCDPSIWITVKASEVDIKLSLRSDSFEFKATCPVCGDPIFNSRAAFR